MTIDLTTAPFVQDLCETAANMYRLGWDERNSGNISLRLTPEEVAAYVGSEAEPLRSFDLGFDAAPLAGECFLATGAGTYFKNYAKAPEENLGLVRISADGASAQLLWGWTEGGRPTSEFPAHLMSHVARLEADPEQRVVMHAHPGKLLTMTFVHSLEERAFTRTLWQMCTECVFIFPEGVAVLPWMCCGTEEIGRATATKMTDARLVVWAHHGIYAAGRSLDETFGLIETAEKAAQVYLDIAHLPRLGTITDDQLWQLCHRFGVEPRAGYLAPETER